MSTHRLNHRIPGLLVLVLVVGILTSCQPITPPDLVPERRTGADGREGFCRREGNDLIVRVRNQTNVDVFIPTSTKVIFSTGDVASESTPPIPGGSMADVAFEIPSLCFDPDCNFTIIVDAEDQVRESHTAQPDNHETNNSEDGVCIG